MRNTLKDSIQICIKFCFHNKEKIFKYIKFRTVVITIDNEIVYFSTNVITIMN